MRRIEKDIGEETIGALTTERVTKAHADWAAPGTVSMANSLIVMLRILAVYGASNANNRACRELKMNLQDLRLEAPEQRTQPLTGEQADLIIAKAHEMGHHSIALAQAFQTDCGLRQRDVIGDWVPVSESIESVIVDGDLKWVSGLRWSEIDQGLTLRHPPSSGGKMVEIRLSAALRVMEELKRAELLFKRPASGPVIVQEGKDIPCDRTSSGAFGGSWRPQPVSQRK